MGGKKYYLVTSSTRLSRFLLRCSVDIYAIYYNIHACYSVVKHILPRIIYVPRYLLKSLRIARTNLKLPDVCVQKFLT